MPSWPAKDPDAVLDYVYRIPLDAGDSVATQSFTRLSGTVNIDSASLAAAPDTTADGYGQGLTAWLSGGVDGETSVFKVEWTTAEQRTADDIITLAVVTNDVPALALTGYAKPLPGHLVARYPAFAAVATATVQYWLTDAERSVDASWSEGDYAAGLMSLAAHNMTISGIGADAAAALSAIPAGVSRFKSGTLEVALTDAAANARMTGDFTASKYGQEYQMLLRRNRGGPVVADTGCVPTYPFGYPPFAQGWY